MNKLLSNETQMNGMNEEMKQLKGYISQLQQTVIELNQQL